MPASWAISFVSSFKLCAVGFETTPVAVTVCPTCSANDTLLLFTSQVLPSSAVSLNSLALSPCARHPVIVRVSDLPFASESCASVHIDALQTRATHLISFFILHSP